eukprot:COSAG02_NODE_30119_length_556_cov_17.564551_1_plen_156_part_00
MVSSILGVLSSIPCMVPPAPRGYVLLFIYKCFNGVSRQPFAFVFLSFFNTSRRLYIHILLFRICYRTVRIAHVWGCRLFADFHLRAQYVPEFLWDRLRASIQFPVMPKRAQYARFSGDYGNCHNLAAEPWGPPAFRVLNFNWKLRPSLAREFLSS